MCEAQELEDTERKGHREAWGRDQATAGKHRERDTHLPESYRNKQRQKGMQKMDQPGGKARR